MFSNDYEDLPFDSLLGEWNHSLGGLVTCTKVSAIVVNCEYNENPYISENFLSIKWNGSMMTINGNPWYVPTISVDRDGNKVLDFNSGTKWTQST